MSLRSQPRRLQRLWMQWARCSPPAVALVVAGPAMAQTRKPIRPGGSPGSPRRSARSGCTAPTAGNGSRRSAIGRSRPATGSPPMPSARVELDLGSTTLRLDAGTELEVQRLDDAQVALFLHDGSVALRVRDAQAAGEFELATDEGRLTVLTRRALSLRPHSTGRRTSPSTPARPASRGRAARSWSTPGSAASSGSSRTASRSTASPIRSATRSPPGSASASATRTASPRLASSRPR